MKKGKYLKTLRQKYKYLHKRTKKNIIKGGTDGTDGTELPIRIELQDGIYIGKLKDGKRIGRGKMTYTDGSIYKGNWENDMRNGDGGIKYADGSVYLGNWKNDMRSGPGKIRYADGSIYDGNWENDMKNGYGMIYYANNKDIFKVFKGNWKNDMKDGEGIYVDKSNRNYKVTFDNDIQIGDIMYENYVPTKSTKPSEIKSAPTTIQLSGNCFAHAIARNLTRLFLILTLIDGEKSEEMFIAIFCFLIIQNSKIPYAYETPPCYARGNRHDYRHYYYDALLENIKTLFTYKYKDIPCELIVGGCFINIKRDNYILTYTEKEQKKFIYNLHNLASFLKYTILHYSFDDTKRNFPPKEVSDLLKKKLQPCMVIEGCNYDPNVYGDILTPGTDIYYNNEGLRYRGTIKKVNKNEIGNVISYEIIPHVPRVFYYVLADEPITIENKNILTTFAHAVVLRSWGKNKNNQEFCYKNTWYSQNNVCIKDVKNICKSFVGEGERLKSDSADIWFITFDIDLDRMAEVYPELHSKIKNRIAMIRDTTYEVKDNKRKKPDIVKEIKKVVPPVIDEDEVPTDIDEVEVPSDDEDDEEDSNKVNKKIKTQSISKTTVTNERKSAKK